MAEKMLKNKSGDLLLYNQALVDRGGFTVVEVDEDGADFPKIGGKRTKKSSAPANVLSLGEDDED